MRNIFGILNFCAAGLLACHIVPAIRRHVIPYWFQGKSGGGFVQIQLGPFILSDPQICIFEMALTSLFIAPIVAGSYEFTSGEAGG